MNKQFCEECKYSDIWSGSFAKCTAPIPNVAKTCNRLVQRRKIRGVLNPSGEHCPCYQKKDGELTSTTIILPDRGKFYTGEVPSTKLHIRKIGEDNE